MITAILVLLATLPNDSLAPRLEPAKQAVAATRAAVVSGSLDSAELALATLRAEWAGFAEEADDDTLVRPIGWTTDLFRIGEELDALESLLAETDTAAARSRLDHLRQLLDWLPGPKPVLMKFTGFRCASCIELEKVLERVAEDYAGRVAFQYVDANLEEEPVRKYRVASLPTTIFLDRKGRERFRFTRELTETEVRARLDALLK